VVIDLDGRTDLPGLYAVGEVSQSGLHGANRLASNRCSNASCSATPRPPYRRHWDELPPPPPIRAWDESRVTDSDEEVVIKQNWTEIRRFMWNYVGIVRTTKRLERAQHRIKLLTEEVADYYGHFRVTPDLIELRNLLQSAELIVRSALHRKESRGLHYTLDYPKTLAKAVDTVLAP
jgi:L-aspartate oxidase